MLVPIEYRSGYKHQLAASVSLQLPRQLWPDELVEMTFIRLDATGWLTIYEKYAWDGASGPTIDFPAKQIVVPSLIHDVLSQLHRAGKLRSVPNARLHLDNLFYEMLRERGMNIVRGQVWYRGVRIMSATPGRQKKILYQS